MCFPFLTFLICRLLPGDAENELVHSCEVVYMAHKFRRIPFCMKETVRSIISKDVYSIRLLGLNRSIDEEKKTLNFGNSVGMYCSKLFTFLFMSLQIQPSNSYRGSECAFDSHSSTHVSYLFLTFPLYAWERTKSEEREKKLR